MSSTSDNAEKSQAPALNLAQFDTGSIGGDCINLFRGNLSFPLKLLSLPSRNQLALDINLLYESNVQFYVDKWNLDGQTDILGMGFTMPFERIILDNKLSGSKLDDEYYVYYQGKTDKLYPLDISWDKGELLRVDNKNLTLGSVNVDLICEFKKSGISLSEKSHIEKIEEDNYTLYDDLNEITYKIKNIDEGKIKVQTGGKSFQLQSYRFWQIVYFEEYNKWQITKEDGTVNNYGGTECENVLQWGIKWGNFIGNRINSKNQERYVTAWNLAKTENICGNYILFNYLVTEQKVGQGQLTYTKECHISKISNDLGWSCKYNYKEMVYDDTALDAPKEYLDPYKDPKIKPDTTADAYQSRYITKYLDKISVFNHNDMLQLYLQFDYYDLKNLTEKNSLNLLSYGALYKRYLKSINQVFPNGDTKLGIKFEYNFSKDKNHNRGALTKIVYPSGGTNIFSYGLVEVGADNNFSPGARSITIENPFGNREDIPRIWYGNDYVICGWYSEDKNQLKINIFTWIGRWHKWKNQWFTLDMLVDLDKLEIAAGEDNFMLYIPYYQKEKGDTYLFNRKKLSRADWKVEKTNSYDSSAVDIHMGNNFFITYDETNKVLDLYSYDELNEKWEIKRISDEIVEKEPYQYYIASFMRYYIVFSYYKEDEKGTFNIYYKDQLSNWYKGGSLSISMSIPKYNSFSYFSMEPSNTFAAIAWITDYTGEGAGFKAFDYSLAVLNWDENYKNISFEKLSDDTSQGFKNVYSPIMPYIGPSVINNALIGSGPNVFLFDSENWDYKFLGIKNDSFYDPSLQYYWYAYGTENAIRVENTSAGIFSEYSALNVNDPNMGWTSQVLQDIEPPNIGREIYGFPSINDRYISQDNKIYNYSLYPLDEDIKKHILTTLKDETIDTTTIINQAPYFLTFMTVDKEGIPKNTNVIFYKNGDLIRDTSLNPVIETLEAQQMFRFLNPQHHYESTLNGKLPAIPQGFVTFSIGDNMEKAKQISLHKYSNYSISEPIKAFVVNQVISDNGYSEINKCYEYKDISSAMDSTGTIIRFQKVYEYEGTLNPNEQDNGYTVSYFCNGLPQEAKGSLKLMLHAEENNYYSVLDGVLILKEQYDSDRNLVSSTENIYSVLTQIAVDREGKEFKNIYGGIPQISSTISMLDGVTTTTNYFYSPSSGAVNKTESSYYDSRGKLINKKSTNDFGYEKYPYMWDKHILKPVVESTILVKEEDVNTWKVQSKIVQTCNQWQSASGLVYYAEHETYTSLYSDAEFIWWERGIPDDKWICTERISKRGVYGEVIESYDVEERVASTLYDDNSRFPIAYFITTKEEINSTSYDCFEQYEKNHWSGGTIINTDSFTGKCSLNLNKTGCISRSIELKATNSYVLGFWYKTSKNGINAYMEIENKTSSNKLQKSLSNTNGLWQYEQWVIELNEFNCEEVSNFQLSIKADILEEGSFLRLDNLFFMPVESSFNAIIYDEDKLLEMASIGINGSCHRSFYNSCDKKIGQSGAYENITAFTTSFISREIMDSLKTSTFIKDSPNFTLTVTGREKGFFDEFKESALDNYELINSKDTDWSIDKNKLKFNNSSSSVLGAEVKRKNFSSNNIGVYVLVDSNENNSINLGTGGFFVKWANGKWQLLKKNGDNISVIQENTIIKFQKEWILLVFDNRLLFYASGNLVFSYSNIDIKNEDHSVILGFSDKGAFNNLLVAEDIGLSIVFTDGKNKPLQKIDMESGDSVILNACLYDDLGNTAIVVKPCRITSKEVSDPFNYYEGLITNAGPQGSVWYDEPMEGPITEIYHPEDEGYPFYRSVYENSPLKRVIKKGNAGRKFSINNIGGTENIHIERFQYKVNSEEETNFYPLPLGEYHVKKHIDQDGNVTINYSDADNHEFRTIYTDEILENPSVIQACTIFDEFGKAIATIPPNYFEVEKSYESLVNEIPSYATYAKYNFIGQVLETKNPEEGTKRCIYNKASKPRFAQDERGRAEGYINYIKYDILGRKVEEGYYETTWDFDFLQDIAYNQLNWPDCHTWSTRYVYDGDDKSQYTLGKIFKAISKDESTEDVSIIDSFSYNKLGSMTKKIREIKSSDKDETFEIDYSYDMLGNTVSVYDSRTKLRVKNEYNTFNKLINVYGETEQGKTLLMSYSYNQEGNIDSSKILPSEQGCLLQRQYGYETTGWMEDLTDDFFQEKLSYAEDFPDKKSYYSGVIAEQNLKYTKGESIQEDFAYINDHMNRVVDLENNESNEKWEFDSNGNAIFHSINGIKKTYEYASLSSNKLLNFKNEEVIQSYSYNENGDVNKITRNESKLMEFHYCKAMDRVESVSLPEKSLNFSYDSNKLRVVKKVTGNSNYSTIYINGLEEHPMIEVHETQCSSIEKRYIYMPGVVAIYINDRYYFALLDHLNSTRMIVDDTGEVVGQYNYDIYGVTKVIKEPDFPYYMLYTSQFYDVETCLYNYNARMYDPIIGRFIMVDPMLQQSSPYVYVGCNPVMLTDPTGEMAIGWWIGAITAGIAVTLITGGIGGFLVGTGIGASMAVGAVAGMAGAMASHAFIAAGNQEKYFSTSLLIDVLCGGAAGLVGAGVGGAFGRGAMKLAFNSGLGPKSVTAIGSVVAGASGGAAGALVSSGISSIAYEQPFFSKSTALNVGLGALVGMGSGILASGAHMGWGKATGDKLPIMPLELDNNVQAGQLDIVRGALPNGQRVIDFNGNEIAQWQAMDNFPAIPKYPHLNNENVVIVHGDPRYVYITMANGQYMRPMKGEYFANLLANQGVAANGQPVRFISCKGAFFNASTIARTLNVQVYGAAKSISVNYTGKLWFRFG